MSRRRPTAAHPIRRGHSGRAAGDERSLRSSPSSSRRTRRGEEGSRRPPWAARIGVDPGVDPYPHLVAGAVGVCLRVAMAQWMRPDPPGPLGALLRTALEQVVNGLPIDGALVSCAGNLFLSMIGSVARTGRPKAELILSDDERAELQRWARRAKSAQALALRSQDRAGLRGRGCPTRHVAAKVGVQPDTVAKWRRRFVDRRLDGLVDEHAPGPAAVDPAGPGGGRGGHHAGADAEERHALVAGVDGPAQRAVSSPRSAGSGATSSSSRTARTRSSSPPTRCSWRRSSTSSGCTTTRPRRRWCCAWTRSRRSRRWTGPSRCCR